MANKKSGSKAKSGGAKGKASMRDLDLKGGQKIRGGAKDKAQTNFSNLSIMKVLDKTTP